jgi:ribosomal protein S18 acetylase RimI-like enzyme
MITLEVIGADNWERWRDMRLDALREAPEAFCSSLSDWEDHSERTWRARLTEVSANFIATLDGKDVGMVSAATSDEEVELIGMWVAPFSRGRGIGDQLVEAVVDWSQSQQPSRLTLRVLVGNDRAVNLYERHGFEYETRSDAGCEPDRQMVHVGAKSWNTPDADHSRTPPVTDYK